MILKMDLHGLNTTALTAPLRKFTTDPVVTD